MDKTDHAVPPSPRTFYKIERENGRAQFEMEAEYKAWSLELEPPPTMKARTALAIFIRHGLFSKTVEMGSLDDFKGVALEFFTRASQRMKVVVAFTEFSMMEVSSKDGLLEIPLPSCIHKNADPLT